MIVFVMVAWAFMMVEQGEAFDGTALLDRAKEVCDPYKKGEKPEPSAECCKVTKEFRDMAKTKEERRELCRRTQEYAKSDVVGKEGLISKIDALAGKCGLSFIFSIDPKFDCNT